jgi:tetratricopeptide (TPR) repeat protein
MAKQQRPSPPKSVKAPPHPSAARPSGHAVTGGAAAPAERVVPQRRSTYVEAVALYERGLEAVGRHEFRAAINMFESVLQHYPEEKELHERVRLYLNICQRQAAPPEVVPQSVDERLYAATLAINGGSYDQAIMNLRLVRDEDPDNDHALYMLAVAHAQRGDLAEAMVHLDRAMALNPENRALARTDPDLEPLRGDETFRAAVETSSTPRMDRRRPLRTRSTR